MAIKARGTTFKKGSTAVAAAMTALNIDVNEDERQECTTLASTGRREYLYSMHNADTIQMDAKWTAKTEVIAVLTDVRDASSDTYTITYDEANTDTTYSGSARATSLTINIDNPGGLTTWSAEWEITGAWTLTAGS